jgi:hypothetical protein
MNILISGCSFSQWPTYPGSPNMCWPKYLQELNPSYKITTLAQGGAGNQYIANSIIQAILDNPTYYTDVLVMWSGVTRLDFLTDITDPNWNELVDSYIFYRRMPNQKLGYIFSGGRIGTWYKHPVAHKIFYEQYKVSSELSLATISLLEIVKLQNFLLNRNISFKFMSYVNYWTDQKDISPNGDFGVTAFPELTSLINEIDFNHWLFTNSEKDGIYELAKSMDNFMEDGFHPGNDTHLKWAELITASI